MTPEPEQDLPTSDGSSRKILFRCSCGRTKLVKWSRVRSGITKTCGECHWDYVPGKQFGRLMLAPDQPHLQSGKKFQWHCSCGRTTTASLGSVVQGKTQSCTRCDYVWLRHGQKVGSFTYEGPDLEVPPHGSTKYNFTCPCGKPSLISLNKIWGQKTCGRCNQENVTYWGVSKFGRLRMKNPHEISSRSLEKVEWICDCGREKSIRVHHVTSGSISSCGRCREKVAQWLDANHFDLSERSRWTASNFPSGGVRPLENIQSAARPFNAICFACSRSYKPRLSDIRRGRSLTCGCSTARISSLNVEIADFLRSLGLSPELEYKVGSDSYDVYVPEKNLIVEAHGLRFHANPESRIRDWNKYQRAIASGYRLINIYEDEWKNRRKSFESLIRRNFQNPGKRLRPTQCSVLSISTAEADLFHESHHYIGPARANINIGVMYESVIIGVLSLRPPTRQSIYDWEIVRMSSDDRFHIHGIWSKLLKRFITEHQPRSVVSFSDNRLFTGQVYSHMGFEFDGNVKPDYFWVKGNKRFHKSKLRKTSEERLSGLTESKLREAQGYKKIWDLGKKRWVLRL